MKSVRLIFTIMLLGFVLALLLIALQYDRKSSLFPILVSGFSLLLGLIVLSMEIWPDIRQLFETNFFKTVTDSEAGSRNVDPVEFGRTAFWMTLILVSVFALGFLLAIPLWVFAYVWIRGRRPLTSAILTALIVWGFVYGFFVKVMGAELFKGLIFGESI